MDGFCEQVVKKNRTLKDKALAVVYILLSIGIPVICILLAYVIVPYFVYIGIFLLMALIPTAVLMIKNQTIEFEYQVVDNYLIIDKIIAKRKRKKLVRVRLEEIKEIVKFNDKDYSGVKINKYFICVDNVEDEGVYSFNFFNEARGNCALVLKPNETIFKGMRPKLPPELQIKVLKILREK
ncbi:MAG: hypothetical protein IJV39_06650 [Ruminococcus sp.]|nr:hypothetical protein [Ruminococcus sp.]